MPNSNSDEFDIELEKDPLDVGRLIIPDGTLTSMIASEVPVKLALSSEEESQIVEAKNILERELPRLDVFKKSYAMFFAPQGNIRMMPSVMISVDANKTKTVDTMQGFATLCRETTAKLFEYTNFLSGRAKALYDGHDYQRAEEEYKAVLDYIYRIVGAKSRTVRVLRAEMNAALAEVSVSQYKSKEAVEAVAKILHEFASELLKEDCEDDTKRAASIAQFHLAQWHLENNELIEAEGYLNESEKLRLAINATELVLDKIRFVRAKFYYKQGDDNKAFKLLQLSYKLREREGGELNSHLIPVIQSMLNILGEESDLSLKLDLNFHLLKIQKHLGRDRHGVIRTQLALLSLMRYRTSDDEFWNMLEDVKEQLEKIPVKEESLEVAVSLADLADVMLHCVFVRNEWPKEKKTGYYHDVLKIIFRAKAHLLGLDGDYKGQVYQQRLESLQRDCERALIFFNKTEVKILLSDSGTDEDASSLYDDMSVSDLGSAQLELGSGTADELGALSNFSSEVRHSQVAMGSKILEVEEFNTLPDEGEIDPCRLRVAQGGINKEFRDGKSLYQAEALLLEDPDNTHQIPAVEIGIHEGKVWSFDSRRLVVHQRAKERNPAVYIRYKKISGDPLAARVQAIFSPRPWNGLVTALRHGGKGSSSEPHINPVFRDQLEEIVAKDFKPFPSAREGADPNGFPVLKKEAGNIYSFFKKRAEAGSEKAGRILEQVNDIGRTQGRDAAYGYLVSLKD